MPKSKKKSRGFSLLELLIAMTVMLLALSIVSSLLARAWSVRARESRTSDALATAQAALDVISREVSNSGFGLYDEQTKISNNGLVTTDCTAHKIRVLSNLENEGGTVTSPGTTTLSINRPEEDVTYFFDLPTQSIVRYDPHGVQTSPGVYGPLTSVVVNRISNVTFDYYNYAGSTSASTGPFTTPTNDTGRVKITVEVLLEPVVGQPNQRITFSSDVTLRNNNYMLKQY